MLLIVGSLVLAGCSGQRGLEGSVSKSCCPVTKAAPAVSYTDDSLYQVESSWTNDVGTTLRLGDLKGRAQVVVLFFASCSYACPILVHDVKRIEAAMPASAGNDWGVTLITIDPDRDTVQGLHAFRLSRGLPEKRWTLLRGSAEDTLELALLLGVKYKREPNGQFAHSNLITILNKEGEIVHQVTGLNQNMDDAVKHIVSATQGQRIAARSHD